MVNLRESTGVRVALVLLTICTAFVPPRKSSGEGQSASRQTILPRTEISNKRICEAAGNQEITIACNYTAIQRDPQKDESDPWIVLDRLIVSFDPHKESEMRIGVTFTNAGATRVPDNRAVYLAIDDEAGNNRVRRVLPHVDLGRIGPGESVTFSERLLVGAFMPGGYFFRFWIPDPSPSLKFNSTCNLLLGSEGVPDSSTGMNTLAELRVTNEGKP